jgi:TRAP-type C4-dicarboxylate transport system permease small subunit
VQAQRGHIGIEALAAVLPPAVNRWRILATEVGSLLFCGFFTVKSWALFREAWIEHQTTASSWGPPLAVPYALMALGMSLLTLQLLLQFASGLARKRAVA